MKRRNKPRNGADDSVPTRLLSARLRGHTALCTASCIGVKATNVETAAPANASGVEILPREPPTTQKAQEPQLSRDRRTVG